MSQVSLIVNFLCGLAEKFEKWNEEPLQLLPYWSHLVCIAGSVCVANHHHWFISCVPLRVVQVIALVMSLPPPLLRLAWSQSVMRMVAICIMLCYPKLSECALSIATQSESPAAPCLLSQTSCAKVWSILLFQMRKLKANSWKQTVQGHIASK